MKCEKHGLAYTGAEQMCALCRRELAEQAKLQIEPEKPPPKWIGPALLAASVLALVVTGLIIYLRSRGTE